jgi:hypothetical protein
MLRRGAALSTMGVLPSHGRCRQLDHQVGNMVGYAMYFYM